MEQKYQSSARDSWERTCTRRRSEPWRPRNRVLNQPPRGFIGHYDPKFLELPQLVDSSECESSEEYKKHSEREE
ncbi:MAG: hypothetical protein ABIG37_02955 [Nanoarchaeota archaeon]|nr:hypothetical protein [Nanoarchaeota archaeon]